MTTREGKGAYLVILRCVLAEHRRQSDAMHPSMKDTFAPFTSGEARGDEKCDTSDTSVACDVIANNLKQLILRISDPLHEAREKRKTPPVVAHDNHGTYAGFLQTTHSSPTC